MKHPIGVTLEVVCGKWKAMVLWYLQEKTLRFGELQRLIPDISHKVLTQQLRELENDGLIERTVYKEIPPKVEYSLTPYGKDLEPILQLLYKWGKNHMDVIDNNYREPTN